MPKISRAPWSFSACSSAVASVGLVPVRTALRSGDVRLRAITSLQKPAATGAGRARRRDQRLAADGGASGRARGAARAQATRPAQPTRRADRKCLERNLVVEVVAGAGHGGLALARGRAGGAEVGRAAVVALAAGAIQHCELRIEALQHDLGGVALLALLIGPFAGLQLAFQINLRALLQVLLGHAAQRLAEDHHAVPFRALAPLARRLAARCLRRSDSQLGHWPLIP